MGLSVMPEVATRQLISILEEGVSILEEGVFCGDLQFRTARNGQCYAALRMLEGRLRFPDAFGVLFDGRRKHRIINLKGTH